LEKLKKTCNNNNNNVVVPAVVRWPCMCVCLNLQNLAKKTQKSKMSAEIPGAQKSEAGGNFPLRGVTIPSQ